MGPTDFETKPAMDMQVSTPVDADGFAIDDLHQPVPDKWARLPYNTRQRLSRAYLERLVREAARPVKLNTTGTGATWYSTKACVKWGVSKGWVEIAREKYDHRLKRLSDVLLGTDVIFIANGKVIAVQAAGRSEKKHHYQRFLDRGGIEKAQRLQIEVWYAEFLRDVLEPVLLEQWA